MLLCTNSSHWTVLYSEIFSFCTQCYTKDTSDFPHCSICLCTQHTQDSSQSTHDSPHTVYRPTILRHPQTALPRILPTPHIALLSILPTPQTALPEGFLIHNLLCGRHFLLYTVFHWDASYFTHSSTDTLPTPLLHKLFYPEHFPLHTLVYLDTSLSSLLLPGYSMFYTVFPRDTSSSTHCSMSNTSYYALCTSWILPLHTYSTTDVLLPTRLCYGYFFLQHTPV